MKTNLILLIFIIIIISFISISKQIVDYYTQTDPILESIIEQIRPLFVNTEYKGILSSINTDNILDNIYFHAGDKSYTINKKHVFMCLLDENDIYYENNMLIYVLLHEISHVICDEIGHTPKFYEIFNNLLKEASNIGVFDFNKPLIDDYCGH